MRGHVNLKNSLSGEPPDKALRQAVVDTANGSLGYGQTGSPHTHIVNSARLMGTSIVVFISLMTEVKWELAMSWCLLRIKGKAVKVAEGEKQEGL